MCAERLAIVDDISEDNPTAAQQLNDEIESKIAEPRRYPKFYLQRRVGSPREMVVRRNYVAVNAEDMCAMSSLFVIHATRQ
jgi:plasmid stabilization system protein ParE